MKANTIKLITAAVATCFEVGNAIATRHNAFAAAWDSASADGMTPRQFRDSVLEAFDNDPWYTPIIGVEMTDEQVEKAIARQRASLSSSLTQIMPKVDPTVSWQFRAAGAGKKPQYQKLGLNVKLLKATLVTNDFTAEQIAFILKSIGVK